MSSDVKLKSQAILLCYHVTYAVMQKFCAIIYCEDSDEKVRQFYCATFTSSDAAKNQSVLLPCNIM